MNDPIRRTAQDTAPSPRPGLSPALPPFPPPPIPDLQPIVCGPEICQSLEKGEGREWIVTNGLGGYASSTILGMNTRRTHGLLVAAIHPPVGRALVLSKVEETVVVPGARFELATNRCRDVIHPEGHRYLAQFRLDPWPTFFYRIGEILLEKSVFMLPGENAVVLGYTLHASPGPVELMVRPLAAFRDFRELAQENDALQARVEEAPGMLTVHSYEDFPPLVIHHNAELVEQSPCWHPNFEYLEGSVKVREDLWSFGHLRYLLKVGESCSLVASIGRRGTGDLAFHGRRVENTQKVVAQGLKAPGAGPLTARLSWTAESFVAQPTLRHPEEADLIAGFHSSPPWGRDTLIALPGLALATGRQELARFLLLKLASQMKEGLLPVRFSELDASAEYDSADTSLWFFWAVWHYWKATRDLKFVAKKLMDPLQQILEAYLEGTRFGIAMDEDGLIRLSDEETPLTWMDAREPASEPKLPGPAVTPRFGKPVEVNALWYCSLRIMGAIAEALDLKRASTYMRLSRLLQQNFLRSFLSPDGILYDRVGAPAPDKSVRPNMLIAVSLPFCPLSRAQSARVLAVVEERLLTPAGVRTLDPADPDYRGRYEGDQLSLSRAYHQGTVWPWLMGPYVSAVCRVRGITRATQDSLAARLQPFLAHLEEGALGSVGEIFDGDPPHAARGVISQAASVGEILRAIREAHLGHV